jgi:hypothetical protein
MQNINENNKVAKSNRSSAKPGAATFYAGLIANIILLYFFNNIIFANIPFLVTKDFISCLWAINLALGVGIIGNFICLIYHPRWFPHLVQALLNLLVILAVYTVYRIFPFNLSSEGLQTAARIILLIIIAGTGIAFVVEAVKAGIAAVHREPPPSTPAPPTPPISPASPLQPEPPISPLPPEPPQSQP